MSKYIIKNCPAYCHLGKECHNEEGQYGASCCEVTDCVMKQIYELCKVQRVINCNIDGKQQVLKAYYHTYLSDKILELLDIQEVDDDA